MDIERLLMLVQSGDLSAFEDLARDIERRQDTTSAQTALALLYNRGENAIAGQWIAEIAKRPELSALKHHLLAASQTWHPGQMRADVQNYLSGDWRVIPGGHFVMGSPPTEKGRKNDETPHRVEMTRPYFLKTTPITQNEWQGLMGNNPSRFEGDLNRPAEKVSWFDAVAFCNALSRKEGLGEAYTLTNIEGILGEEGYTCDVSWKGFDCDGYRLPTEAEWEYAARAGTITAFYNGDCLNPTSKDPNLDQIAWYNGNSGETTHPVKGKEANAWGLYDMSGNVYEWCWDWYATYPSGSQSDPKGPSSVASARVLRGGSWNFFARVARAANRFSGGPGYCGSYVGFRPARSKH